nr:MAG TPA: hypothetical protein [Caudoviricetes sp.]
MAGAAVGGRRRHPRRRGRPRHGHRRRRQDRGGAAGGEAPNRPGRCRRRRSAGPTAPQPRRVHA